MGISGCVCDHHFQQTGHQPGMVDNPACGQLNREHGIVPVAVRVWEFDLASWVRPSRPASARSFSTPKAEYGAYLRYSTSPYSFSLRFSLESPCTIGLVPSLSGQAIALSMAFITENQHSASSSQGSSINGSFLLK